MRIPDAAHLSRPWRIREMTSDFTLEDVWALPVHGRREDFGHALELLTSLDPANTDSRAARFLWNLRDLMGRVFGLGRISTPASDETRLAIPGTDETSLLDRLPEDLRGTATDVDFGRVPFVALYRTDDEFAAEVSNRTVHGVLHLGWVDRGEGRYQGQMAVYVKPRDRFGQAYMALIRPFRHLVVYPALMREIERTWRERGGMSSATQSADAAVSPATTPIAPP